MSGGLPRTLTIVGAVGSGVVAGVFFAFSTFVMKALDRLPPAQGLTAMQAINKAAPNAWFMTVLFGTALVCVGLGAVGRTRLSEATGVYLVVGSALYLAAIALTIVYHVPHNDSLALVDPNTTGAAAEWARYASQWTAWNHVRTLTSLAAAVTFTLALR